MSATVTMLNDLGHRVASNLGRMSVELVILAAVLPVAALGRSAAAAPSGDAQIKTGSEQTAFVVGPVMNRLSDIARQEWQSKGITSKEQMEAQFQEVAIQLLRKRFEAAGLKDVVLEKLPKGGQIRVKLASTAGVEELERAKALVRIQGRLSFHKIADRDELAATLDAIKANYTFGVRFSPLVKKADCPSWPFVIQPANLVQAKALIADINVNPKLLPEGKILALGRAELAGHTLYLVSSKPDLENIAVGSAFAAPDKQQPDRYDVLLRLFEEDENRFGQFTEQNLGKAIVVILDGEVQCAPVVRSRITRNVLISANYNSREAGELAVALRSGSFPAPLVTVTLVVSETGNNPASGVYRTAEGGYTHLVVFEPVGDFKPQTPKELLDVFNGICKVKTGYFRTEPHDGRLFGSICTDDPEGLQKGLVTEPRLKWTTAVPLTPERFEAHAALKQESP